MLHHLEHLVVLTGMTIWWGFAGYLRFGSKIRQGFAGGITSLTPPLSLFPLWISWAENEGAREGVEFYIWGGSLPLGRGATGTCQGLLCKKNYFYFHIDPYRPPGGRGIEL